MKTLLLTLFFLLTITAAWAQAPQRISYQSIIRDANNVVVASSAVRVKISLLRGTATGPAVYVETHPITTNANGLVSLNIGEGRAITGTFAEIDWSNGPYLIQTATDPTGGTDYSIIGFAPLNSVPYALNAANASVTTTLAGTLPIASGGTGATTATAARTSLGLENVDNTSDANKPVSTAAQTTLSTKVDKVTGKELSTNDYSTAEKAKLAAITGNNTGDQDLSSFATSSQLATKVDKVTGKELSTNDYSTVEKTKLASITGTNTGDQVNIAGNAATATKLQATVTINGIAFDGSANVTIPAIGAVPYTGATQAVDLGAYDLKVNGLTVGRGSGNMESNTATGDQALASNTTGSANTASGAEALKSNTTGSENSANGAFALSANTIGDRNTANGVTALYANTTGSYNTANGMNSLFANTTGSYNTANGMFALYRNTTGSYNTANGVSSLFENTTGSYNTANGFQALLSNTTGASNTANGEDALRNNTTGAYNTASGASALYSNTTGAANTATGYSALRNNTTGANNTASGTSALFANTTGAYNTATGLASLTRNTTGSDNTASGYAALFANTTGGANMAYGNFALGNNTTGSGNTASGHSALDANTTGTNNTAIGYYTNVGSDNLTNATAIGAGAIVNSSDNIQLGNSSVTNVKTSGTITAGTVTYPNAHNSTAGQALTTNALGVASWTTPAAELPTSGNTPGDMLFWDGSAWVKVAAGTDGQTLTFVGGKPAWTNTISFVNTVTSTTGKIWMDRNLGASQVATSSTDAASYGDLYQWGRGADGHQSRTSGTTTVLSSLDQPGNGNFILTTNSPNDWRSSQNANLWQGVAGVNNPCPRGYRLPTDPELTAERAAFGTQNAAGAFASPLKLPTAGLRDTNGLTQDVGTFGVYWSSTVFSSFSYYFYFNSSSSGRQFFPPANGLSVRCTKD
jgi:hypothetical protein